MSMQITAALSVEHDRPIVISQLDIREPLAGEALVELSHCGVCHSDLSAHLGLWGTQVPAVFGHEAVGIVSKSKTNKYQAGDRVLVTLLRNCGHCAYCNNLQPTNCSEPTSLDKFPPLSLAGQSIKQGIYTGAFASAALVHESQLAPLPSEDKLPGQEACLLACGVLTAYGSLRHIAKVSANQSIAILGTGGIGMNCVQIANILGIRQIIAIDIDDKKLQLAQQFGATDTINPKTLGEQTTSAIHDITASLGVDHLILATAGRGILEQSLNYLKKGGAVTLVSMAPVGMKSNIEIVNFAFNAHQLLGSRMGSVNLATDLLVLLDWYDQGKLNLSKLISAIYPLGDINTAFTQLAKGNGLRYVLNCKL